MSLEANTVQDSIGCKAHGLAAKVDRQGFMDSSQWLPKVGHELQVGVVARFKLDVELGLDLADI